METSLRIPTPWKGAPVYLRETTGSTMDDALALARDGCPSGTTVAAGYQEKGRGRGQGTRWLSGPWQSLLATVVLHRDEAGFPLTQLSLRAGLAVALAVEDLAGLAVRIKWPNDLLWQGRKLAGILCEARGSVLLVGIGVNCAQDSFPPEIAAQACSLRMAAGRDIAPLEILPAVLARLKECLRGCRLAREGPRPALGPRGRCAGPGGGWGAARRDARRKKCASGAGKKCASGAGQDRQARSMRGQPRASASRRRRKSGFTATGCPTDSSSGRS